MNRTHAIGIATAVLACPLLLSTQVLALEIPEPGDTGARTTGVACSALPKDQPAGTKTPGAAADDAPVVYGFMSRPGW